MADPKAKDTHRGMPHAREPSPNEVAGQYDRVDPEELNEEQAKHWRPGQLDLNSWNPPVDPSKLDEESHVTIVPRNQRDEANIIAVPTASAEGLDLQS